MQSSRNPRGADAGRSPDPAGRMQVAAGSDWTSDKDTDTATDTTDTTGQCKSRTTRERNKPMMLMKST